VAKIQKKGAKNVSVFMMNNSLFEPIIIWIY